MTDPRPSWTILRVLDWTRGHFERKGLSSPRLDAEVLLSHVLATPRVMLYAHFDKPLAEDELGRMRALVARRAAGVPVAHLLGRREFWSLELEVTPDVLVPRPETELLVEVALRRAPGASRVIDVGTGSGAVAFALATELPAARVLAVDVSPRALAVAARNAAALGLAERVTVAQGHLFDAVPRESTPADLIVANLPYIPTVDIDGLAPEVRDHEPRLALDGGPDGLDLVRALVADAPRHMAPGGVLALEAGYDQAPAVGGLLRARGFADVEVDQDLAGLDRITSASWPGA